MKVIVNLAIIMICGNCFIEGYKEIDFDQCWTAVMGGLTLLIFVNGMLFKDSSDL